jgi:hypothetical protein
MRLLYRKWLYNKTETAYDYWLPKFIIPSYQLPIHIIDLLVYK